MYISVPGANISYYFSLFLPGGKHLKLTDVYLTTRLVIQ